MMAVAQVRNKQVTKHFTEKTVKEIWKDRMAERKSGKATDLCDFVCNHFQKKIGIMSAVVEVGAELPCSMILRAVIRKALCLYADGTASSVVCRCTAEIPISASMIRGPPWLLLTSLL